MVRAPVKRGGVIVVVMVAHCRPVVAIGMTAVDDMSSILLGRSKGAQFPQPYPDANSWGNEGALFPRRPNRVRVLYDPAHGCSGGSFINGPVSRCTYRHKFGHRSKAAIVLRITRVLQCTP